MLARLDLGIKLECVQEPMYWSSEFRGSFRELFICYNTHGQGELQSAPAKGLDRPFRRTPWPLLDRMKGRTTPDLTRWREFATDGDFNVAWAGLRKVLGRESWVAAVTHLNSGG